MARREPDSRGDCSDDPRLAALKAAREISSGDATTGGAERVERPGSLDRSGLLPDPS